MSRSLSRPLPNINTEKKLVLIAGVSAPDTQYTLFVGEVVFALIGDRLFYITNAEARVLKKLCMAGFAKLSRLRYS
jgi:hypothetical protein